MFSECPQFILHTSTDAYTGTAEFPLQGVPAGEIRPPLRTPIPLSEAGTYAKGRFYPRAIESKTSLHEFQRA